MHLRYKRCHASAGGSASHRAQAALLDYEREKQTCDCFRIPLDALGAKHMQVLKSYLILSTTMQDEAQVIRPRVNSQEFPPTPLAAEHSSLLTTARSAGDTSMFGNTCVGERTRSNVTLNYYNNRSILSIRKNLSFIIRIALCAVSR